MILRTLISIFTLINYKKYIWPGIVILLACILIFKQCQINRLDSEIAKNLPHPRKDTAIINEYNKSKDSIEVIGKEIDKGIRELEEKEKELIIRRDSILLWKPILHDSIYKRILKEIKCEIDSLHCS